MYFVTFLMYAMLYMHYHCYLADTGNRDMVVTIVIRLWAGRSCNRGSIPDSGNSPPSSSKNSEHLWGSHRLLEISPHFSRVYSSRVFQLTTHLHLVARLRVSGSMPPLFHMSSWHGREKCTLNIHPTDIFGDAK